MDVRTRGIGQRDILFARGVSELSQQLSTDITRSVSVRVKLRHGIYFPCEFGRGTNINFMKLTEAGRPAFVSSPFKRSLVYVTVDEKLIMLLLLQTVHMLENGDDTLKLIVVPQL